MSFCFPPRFFQYIYKTQPLANCMFVVLFCSLYQLVFLCNMEQQAADKRQECCMCGDHGFSDQLFRCKFCHFRSQHRYCSNLYPKAEAYGVCNWCLISKRKTDHETLVIRPSTSLDQFSGKKRSVEDEGDHEIKKMNREVEEKTKRRRRMITKGELEEKLKVKRWKSQEMIKVRNKHSFLRSDGTDRSIEVSIRRHVGFPPAAWRFLSSGMAALITWWHGTGSHSVAVAAVLHGDGGRRRRFSGSMSRQRSGSGSDDSGIHPSALLSLSLSPHAAAPDLGSGSGSDDSGIHSSLSISLSTGGCSRS